MCGRWNYSILENLEISLWDGEVFLGLQPHFHPEAQICMLLEGERSFCIASQLVKLSAGDVLFIGPNIPHAALSQSQHFRCQNVYLNEAQLGFSAPKCAVISEFDFPVESNQSLCPLLPMVLSFVEDSDSCEQTFGSILQSEVLVNVASGIETIAQSHNCSREHYSRSFKHQHGISPQSARMALRANKARELLRNGTLLNETALDCGYSDQSHLARHFRNFFGVTPGNYRDAVAVRHEDNA